MFLYTPTCRHYFEDAANRFDNKSPTEMANITLNKLDNSAQNDQRYSPEVRRQIGETAQMLRDLKANDPKAFENFGKGMQAKNGTAYLDLVGSLDNLCYDEPVAGATPTINPNGLKTTMASLIKDPANAIKILDDRYVSDVPQHVPTEPSRVLTPVSPPIAKNNTPAPSAAVPPSTNTFVAATTPRTQTPATQTATPTERKLTDTTPTQVKPPETSPTNTPGMALSALSLLQGNKFGASGGFDFGQIGNFIKEIMQKISNFFSGTSSVTVMGNDGGKLTQEMAKITGTNPQVVDMSPNGQERDLGRARDIGQVALADPALNREPQNRNIPGISTPSYSR